MPVVWIMEMQYGSQIFPMVIFNIFSGFGNFKLMQSIFLADLMAQLRHVGPRPRMG